MRVYLGSKEEGIVSQLLYLPSSSDLYRALSCLSEQYMTTIT